jgi:hypothetical protein
MNEALLVICPEDPEHPPPSIDHLTSSLNSVGLTGKAIIQDGYTPKQQYMAGERFLDLIAFLGCSPNIKLEPDEDHQSFCHINIVVNQGEGILFRPGRQTTPPRCPSCRKPLKNWRELISPGALPDELEWRCPDCGQYARPWQYDWRKTAGFGRCFIEITDIYPKEALPQSSLLDALMQEYSIDWTWFYQF